MASNQDEFLSVFYFHFMSILISVKSGRVNTYFYFHLETDKSRVRWPYTELLMWKFTLYTTNAAWWYIGNSEHSELQWIVHTVWVTEACEISWLSFIVVGFTYERHVNWGIAQKGQEEEEGPKNTILSQKEERKEEDCWSIGSKTMKWVVCGC